MRSAPFPLCAFLLASSCIQSADPELDPEPEKAAEIEALYARFAAYAARVVAAEQAFAVRADGSTFRMGGGAEGLQITIPSRGDGVIRLKRGAFSVRVREIGADARTAIAGRAVVHRREAGASFWSASARGVEEWIRVDEGQAYAGVPLLSWSVKGARLGQRGAAVVLLDEAGAPQLWVTAPEAYARSGRALRTQLWAKEDRIELFVDTGGEEALIDPLWTTAPPMQSPRADHTLVNIWNKGILAIGGWDGSNVLKSTELYDPYQDTWVEASPMETARLWHMVVRLDDGMQNPKVDFGKVLVMGGLQNPDDKGAISALASVELYDPQNDTWATIKPMNTPRAYACRSTPFSAGGKVMIVGGVYQNNVLSSTEIYEPATGTWSLVGSMNTPRQRASVLPLKDFKGNSDKLFVVGGAATTAPDAPGLASTEIFDPKTGTWSFGKPMNRGRWGHDSVVLAGSRLLVAGGRDGGEVLIDGEIYNLETNTWSTIAPMSAPLNNLAGAWLPFGGGIVAFGEDITKAGTALADYYDEKSDTWSSYGPLTLIPRGKFTAEWNNVNDKILLCGGYDAKNPTMVTNLCEGFWADKECVIASDCKANECQYPRTCNVSLCSEPASLPDGSPCKNGACIAGRCRRDAFTSVEQPSGSGGATGGSTGAAATVSAGSGGAPVQSTSGSGGWSLRGGGCSVAGYAAGRSAWVTALLLFVARRRAAGSQRV